MSPVKPTFAHFLTAPDRRMLWWTSQAGELVLLRRYRSTTGQYGILQDDGTWNTSGALTGNELVFKDPPVVQGQVEHPLFLAEGDLSTDVYYVADYDGVNMPSNWIQFEPIGELVIGELRTQDDLRR